MSTNGIKKPEIKAQTNKVKKKKMTFWDKTKRQWEKFNSATEYGDKIKRITKFHKDFALVFKTSAIMACILGLICALIAISVSGIFLFIIVWPIISIVAEVLFLSYYRSTNIKTQRYDDINNISIGIEKDCGSADRMQEEEQEVTLNKGTFYELADNIIGEIKDKPGITCSPIRDYITRLNGNVLVIGNPGSGKSRCYILPNLMQILRRRESAVITDSKGELFAATSEMARAHGYDVKIVNFDPKMFAHSDGINFFNGMTGIDYDKAMDMASTIIDNSMGAHESEDFFSKMEKTLLLACILLAIDENDSTIEPSIGGIYNYVSTHTPVQLCMDFERLPDTHPAKGPYNIYHSAGDTVMGNALGGLAIRLTIFNSPLLRKITSEAEIDFLAPGQKPCFYYVSMSDQNSNYTFLIALFFECLISGLVTYADSQSNNKLPVKVNLMLDEFYSCGNIPHFDKRLSNIRSRGIDTTIILQSMGQLQQRFPNGLDEAIVDCCSLQILLGTNSNATAKHFSDRSGITTIRTKSESFTESRFKLANNVPEIHVNYSNKSRPVYTVDEIQRIDSQSLLAVVAGHNTIELGRMDYSRHPMCKEIRPSNAATHTPEWYVNLDEYERDLLGIPENEKYEEEGWWNIPLCTEEDFKEEWNPEKEQALQDQIRREKAIYDKKHGIKNNNSGLSEKPVISEKTRRIIKQHINDINIAKPQNGSNSQNMHTT